MRKRRIRAEMLCVGDVIIRDDGTRLHVIKAEQTGCYPTRVYVQPFDSIEQTPASSATWLSIFTEQRIRVQRRHA